MIAPAAIALALLAQVPQQPQRPDTVRLQDLDRRLVTGAPADSVYASPALRALVTRAAEVNGVVPAALDSYEADVETDLALMRSSPTGEESTMQLEQVASRLWWTEGRPVLQRMIGYRSQTLGLSPSTLSFFEVPWLVPHLYGDRIDLVHTGGPRRDAQGRPIRIRTIHPFASDRERVYAYEGGDTVDVLRLPDRTIPIARVRVRPRAEPERASLAFEGFIDVELNTHHIVRMSGRIFALGLKESAASRLLEATLQGVLFVEFENAEYDEAYWLPRTQRIEAQAITQLGDSRIAYRVMSRFGPLIPNIDVPAEVLALDPLVHPYGKLETASRGQLAAFDDWRLEPGAIMAGATVRDFQHAAPPALAETGSPRLRFGARHLSHLIRQNRVEGLFTGAGLTLDLRDAAPGWKVRAHGGWAWSEGTARGGAEIARQAGEWETIARAERQLAHTNDFMVVYDPEPGVPPLFAGDVYDYLDRRIASLIAQQPRSTGWRLRFEAGRAGDRAVRTNLEKELFSSDEARPNRPIAEGDYWIGRATVHRNPGAGGLALQPGTRVRLHWEGATGALDWQRLEAGFGLRAVRGRFTLAGRADGGAVLASAPPPQTLLELGTTSGLSGYPTKAFTGDRAFIAKAMTMFTLPILNAPLSLGPVFKLPAPAPSPSVEVQVGATHASDDALAVMQPFGWVDSDGVKAVLDLRMRFFGGGVSIGAARPLGADGRWRFVWGLVTDL